MRWLLALWLSASAEAVEPGACVVRGESITLDVVTVQPKGDAPFTIGLRKVAARASLPRRFEDPLVLQVEGPLSFQASRKNVWLSFAADFKSPDGMLEIRRGAQLVRPRVERDGVAGSLILSADDVLEGEDKPAAELAAPAHVPCSALVLGLTPLEEEPPSGGPEVPMWEPKRKVERLQLRASPKAGAPSIWLQTPSCEGCLFLSQVGEERGWLRVSTSESGVTVTGWVPRAELSRVPEGVGVGRAAMCTGDHGGGMWGEGLGDGPPQALYEGPALVRLGAEVFSGPKGGKWATFTRETAVKVRAVRGEGWVELRAIPGLDGVPSGSPWLHAHVRVENVVFPDGGW